MRDRRRTVQVVFCLGLVAFHGCLAATPIVVDEPVPLLEVPVSEGRVREARDVTPENPDVPTQAWLAMRDLGRLAEFECLANIFERESGWNPATRGDGGDSYGLPQRHAPSHGVPPEPWPVHDQVVWAVGYADGRYGGVCEAWAAWQVRAEKRHGKGWW